MKRLLNALIISFIALNTVAHADGIDSLTLTDAEMQKLKKYFPTDDSSHLVWKGDPLMVSLPLVKEKRLIFPSTVSADIKGALNTDQLRLLNDNKSLYLTALKPFSTTRIYVTLKESGEVVLIDLTTNEQASASTQEIDVKKTPPSHSETSNNVMEASISMPNDTTTGEGGSYVDLIRFAWQQAYARERLLRHSSSYARAPMHTQKFVSDLVYGDKVTAYPEGSWLSGSHYVTAVILRNKYLHNARIDVRRDLCGDWQAATLYPRSTLKPYGDKNNDSTTLFIVSSRPFGDTLEVCHGNA